MKIERLSEEECYAALTSGLGRLACARDGQPYVVPIYFVVSHHHLYSFALPGQKVDWMRQNPLVCIETDTVDGGNDWTSVVALGRYQELMDAQFERERALAHRLLQHRPMWWEPGATTLDGYDGSRGYAPIFYRVLIDSISGQRGVPAPGERALPYVKVDT